jgi:hypothetical protein
MKRIFIVMSVIVILSTLSFADAASDLLQKVYANNKQLNTLDVVEDSTTTETAAATNKISVNNESRHILFNKKSEKLKLTYNNAKQKTASNGKVTATNPGTFILSGRNASMHPECLYNIEGYLSNFDVKIMKKDERIKRGGEEIVATRKGQKTEFPQIRIFIKNDQVHEMKFYSMTGKKYYELKTHSYSTINGVDVPDSITESIFAKKNRVDSEFRYSNTKVNTTITDNQLK